MLKQTILQQYEICIIIYLRNLKYNVDLFNIKVLQGKQNIIKMLSIITLLNLLALSSSFINEALLLKWFIFNKASQNMTGFASIGGLSTLSGTAIY